jgi:adenylylsulfate kinase
MVGTGAATRKTRASQSVACHPDDCMPDPRHIVRHIGAIQRHQRERLLGQRGAVAWFTGLSGSGKSTIAHALQERLHAAGKLVYVLDGDNLRHGLCADLGFGHGDRSENIRRAAHVAALFADAGILVLTSFISPYRADRQLAREVVGVDFLEIYVDAPLAVCEQRDPKGLYRKARAGEIQAFTGISAPYEVPLTPEIHLRTADLALPQCVDQVQGFLTEHGLLRPPDTTAP